MANLYERTLATLGNQTQEWMLQSLADSHTACAGWMSEALRFAMLSLYM